MSESIIKNHQWRCELLEAFASSKAAEFEGFKASWLEAHPEPAAEPEGTDSNADGPAETRPTP